MTIESISPAAQARPAERSAARAEALPPPGATRVQATALDSDNAVKGAARAEPTQEQVEQAVSDLNNAPQAKAQGLEFSIDKDSQRTVVKVVDQSTKEVLRQIPSVEALEIAKSLDSSKSLLLKQTA
jgi:flagellar protein FlaG